MSEMHKAWLLALFDGEIATELGTVANERTWADGANGPDTRDMHLANAASHEEYVEVLRGLRARVADGTLP